MDMAARDDALETYWPYVDAYERGRFAGSVYFRSGNECWIWLGGIESDGGYSRFRSETLGVIAGHRWSALAHHGALAEPVVRHRCDVRCCVRPDHLAVGRVRRTSLTRCVAGGGRATPRRGRERGQRCLMRFVGRAGTVTTGCSPSCCADRSSWSYGRRADGFPVAQGAPVEHGVELIHRDRVLVHLRVPEVVERTTSNSTSSSSASPSYSNPMSRPTRRRRRAWGSPRCARTSGSPRLARPLAPVTDLQPLEPTRGLR